MGKSREKREPKQTEFDLTPMIDVTFQLLIFFIVAMKIRQRERREYANLPQDEGPAPTPAEPKDFVVVRLFWRNNEMTYEVNFKHGNNEGKGPKAIHAGNLAALMADRQDPTHSAYQQIYAQLLDRVREIAAKVPTAEKFEIAMSSNTQQSSALHIEQTAPWGFVTLVLDVATQFNIERKAAGLKEYGITFKNTEPAGQRIAAK